MDSTLSLSDLMAQAAQWRWFVAGVLIIAPLVAWWAAQQSDRGRRRNWLYVLSVVSYTTVLPGVFMTFMVAYMLFFTRQNLVTDADLVLVFGPIVSMAVSITLMRRFVALNRIPGFDNLSGLAIVGAVSFLVLLLILKLRILVGFFGNALHIIVFFLALYWAFHFGLRKLRSGR